MPLGALYERVFARTRRAPLLARIAGAAGITLLCVGVRYAVSPVAPQVYPLISAFLAVLLSATLFDGLAGLASVVISVLACAYLFFPPVYSLVVEQSQHVAALVAFAAVGGLTILIVETLHSTMDDLHVAQRRAHLLLIEHRHRIRNDLQIVCSQIDMRARVVADPAARAALREASATARHLAAIHRRLERATYDRDEVATVDVGPFVAGLCADLPPPVEVTACHGPLSSERGVHLGLLLGCLVSQARRGGAGRVRVQLERNATRYALRVVDDRPAGAPDAHDALSERMVLGLARQLRGTHTKTLDLLGQRVSTTSLPIVAPVLPPGHVGK